MSTIQTRRSNRRFCPLQLLGLFLAVSCNSAFSQESADKNAIKDTPVVLDTVSIAKFSPRARADVVAALLQEWRAASEAGIITPLRIQHFMTQIATETGGLRILEENLSYSAERLLAVFPKRVAPSDAQQLAFRPMAIANHVYNGRLGNTPPSDGWLFRGSGLIQLTGRYNYAQRGLETGFPLEQQPELVRSAKPAFLTAVAYWKAKNINAPADKDNLKDVRIRVNGGTNGLPEARIWLARARKYFPDPSLKEATDPAEEEKAVEDILEDMSLLKRSPDKALQEQNLSEALRVYQESKGLAPTGEIDDDTLYSLTDPEKFRPE